MIFGSSDLSDSLGDAESLSNRRTSPAGGDRWTTKNLMSGGRLFDDHSIDISGM